MKVCFIGHRKIDKTEQLKLQLTNIVSTLISGGADTFIFGSKSDFDSLCWDVVTECKAQFPNIKRISYNAPHEIAFTSAEERKHCEQILSRLLRNEVHYADYEEAVDCEKSYNANKNAYIMRNQEMIDCCDICVFYYNEQYLPPRRKQSKKDILGYQPKSGTAIAFAYAKRKRKQIINLYEKCTNDCNTSDKSQI